MLGMKIGIKIGGGGPWTLVEYIGGIITLASFFLMFWFFGIVSALLLIPIFWFVVTPIVGTIIGAIVRS